MEGSESEGWDAGVDAESWGEEARCHCCGWIDRMDGY